ncbi:MAG TPA: hypothetical protein VFV57_12660 [Limnobacter sp.]|nr:hypothetical protein [Limnobacter sp.]
MPDHSVIQLIPPALVVLTVSVACYFFYSRFVTNSKHLCSELERIGNTIRSMSEGDENQRHHGVAKAFQDTPFESIWREFSKTLHAQTQHRQSNNNTPKYRLTVPASHFFSAAAIVDRQLGVEYFKHLPGILTGIGIIGTFSGLLFGLSNFDASDALKMNQSIATLLAGVRDAFYASAVAISAAMVITHWEKLIYRRCLMALDHLVNCLNGLFDGAVGEEYLATLVEHSANTTGQARQMKEEMLQAMVPLLRQMESVQAQHMESFAKTLETTLAESNKKLAIQIEAALVRQVKTPLDELAQQLNSRAQTTGNSNNPMLTKVIRARQGDQAKPSELAQ